MTWMGGSLEELGFSGNGDCLESWGVFSPVSAQPSFLCCACQQGVCSCGVMCNPLHQNMEA